MEDISKLLSVAHQFVGTMKNEQERILEDTAKQYQHEVKVNTPVDTGKLKESIEIHRQSSEKVTITSDVDYAIYVDQGHSTKSGKFVEGKGMFQKAGLNVDNNIEKNTKEMYIKLDKIWGGR